MVRAGCWDNESRLNYRVIFRACYRDLRGLRVTGEDDECSERSPRMVTLMVFYGEELRAGSLMNPPVKITPGDSTSSSLMVIIKDFTAVESEPYLSG